MATEGKSGAASGGQLEERLDFTKETDLALAQCASLLEDGHAAVLPDVLAILAALEKKCRVGNDAANLARICTAALQACYDAHDPAAVRATLTAYATKRSQKVAAIRALVTTAVPWCIVTNAESGGSMRYTPVPVSNDEERAHRLALLLALREITDGKLFLERERAQLTRALATIQEEEGDISAAADTLQEVHVETYGSLSKKEKVEYILEQLRLTIRKHDFVRAAIVAGKINRKHLPEMPDYKIRFFTLMSTIHRQERNALELVKDYHAIYLTHLQLMESTATTTTEETAMEEEDGDAAWKDALQAVVVFLALAPYSNEQQDLLHRVSVDEHLEKLPAHFPSTVQLLLKKEIMHSPVPHQAEMEQLPVILEDDLGAHWHETWVRRVLQHNIRVASLYYTRIHGARLAALLQLSAAELEAELASMVSDGAVVAKIHRPRDIIVFGPPPSATVLLHDWSKQIDALLQLVDTTTHWIHKEQMTTAAASS